MWKPVDILNFWQVHWRHSQRPFSCRKRYFLTSARRLAFLYLSKKYKTKCDKIQIWKHSLLNILVVTAGMQLVKLTKFVQSEANSQTEKWQKLSYSQISKCERDRLPTTVIGTLLSHTWACDIKLIDRLKSAILCSTQNRSLPQLPFTTFYRHPL